MNKLFSIVLVLLFFGCNNSDSQNEIHPGTGINKRVIKQNKPFILETAIVEKIAGSYQRHGRDSFEFKDDGTFTVMGTKYGNVFGTWKIENDKICFDADNMKWIFDVSCHDYEVTDKLLILNWLDQDGEFLEQEEYERK